MPELFDDVGRVAAQRQQWEWERFLPQPLLHSRHGCVGGKEHQRVTGGCFDESDELGSQLIKVHIRILHSLAGRDLRKVEQAVVPVVKGGWRNGFHDAVSLLQSCLRFETAEIAAHRHGAGGQNERLIRLPQDLFYSLRDIAGCGAQHGAACADIFGSVKNHICLGTGEQLDRVQHRIQLAASQRGEQAADLPLDDGQCAGWRGQQSQTGFHRLRFLSGLCQLAQQRTCAVLQHLCRQ